MTPLTKPVHRVVEIEGQEYIASLAPATEDNPASFTLRKKKHRSLSASVAMEDTLEAREFEGDRKVHNLLDRLPSQTEQTAERIATRLRDEREALWSEERYRKYASQENDPIHPKDLKMWAKYGYPKFNDAWRKYKAAIARHNPTAVKIFWGKDNSVEVMTPESGEASPV
jgi:hypothetical protein